MSVDVAVLAVLWLSLTGMRAVLLDVLPATGQLFEDVSFLLHAWMIVVFAPAWAWSLSRSKTYASLGAPANFASIAHACMLATLICLGLFFATHVTEFLSRSLVFTFAILSAPALLGGRRLLHRAAREGWIEEEARNILFIGSASESEALLKRTQANALGRLGLSADEQQGSIPFLGTVQEIGQVLARHPVDQVLLTERGVPHEVLRVVASRCEEVGVPFSMEAGFIDRTLARATLEQVDDVELITFTSLPHDPSALAIKRAMDVLFASTLLCLLSPLMLLVALAIRVEDAGPVIFRQERVGRFGRRFTMLKFRSMYTNAEARLADLADHNEADGPVFKMASDPRVTRIGWWIRRSSIDELPQLLNVLRGEMSMVGPRPPLPREVCSYEAWQRRRLSMKPGLTCIWQVSGRSRIDFDTWMRLDLEYIDNWSLTLDLLLILRTVPAVLTGDGAR